VSLARGDLSRGRRVLRERAVQRADAGAVRGGAGSGWRRDCGGVAGRRSEPGHSGAAGGIRGRGCTPQPRETLRSRGVHSGVAGCTREFIGLPPRITGDTRESLVALRSTWCNSGAAGCTPAPPGALGRATSAHERRIHCAELAAKHGISKANDLPLGSSWVSSPGPPTPGPRRAYGREAQARVVSHPQAAQGQRPFRGLGPRLAKMTLEQMEGADGHRAAKLPRAQAPQPAAPPVTAGPAVVGRWGRAGCFPARLTLRDDAARW